MYDVRVGNVDKVVRNNVRCLVEPEVGDGVQRLPLERNRSQDPVESGLPVGRDDRSNPVRDVAITDLAFVRATDVDEIR